jgi:hypothetical protein
MAEKIILELKDKDFVKSGSYFVSSKDKELKHNIESNLKSDIISTLTSM